MIGPRSILLVVMGVSLAGGACGTDSSRTDRCVETIDECLANGDCASVPPTWQDAQIVQNWGYVPCAVSDDVWLRLSACSSSHEASITFIDTRRDYTYDANGKLTRVENNSVGGVACVAGDSTGAVPASGCTTMFDSAVCLPH